jgi:5S rRNA maturation endonuclease (ribonuclease M5)
MGRGKGTRCYGFLSSDGKNDYAHCTRDEPSNGLPQTKGGTFAHLLYGDCNCGTEHNPKQTRSGGSSKSKQPSTLTADGYLAEFDYLDESGELLYQVCKKTDKKFLQRRPGTDGKWVWNLRDVRRVLYRLPELLKADKSETVFIAEGEKDVESLRSVGLTATTNSGGAGQSGKWLEEFNDYLKNRPVIILPDNDDVGRSHAVKIANSLKGTAKSIKIVNLPGLPEKGDVSDWLESGGTVEKLNELIKKDSTKPTNSNIISAADLMAKEFPEQKYAVEGILSEGVTIFAGKPKLGKSWCGLGLALAIASGGKAFGKIPVVQGNVLYLALEDGERRLQDRFEKLLGNEGKIPADLHFATHWESLDNGGLEALESWLIEHPKARIIFIDTLKRVRPKNSGNKQLYDSDYEAISPLGDLAREYGVSIVLIHHTRKQDSEDPMDLISGSTGLTGSADGALVLTRARQSVQCKLHVMGRDNEDKELILDWSKGTFGWTLAGDAEELAVSRERKDIIEILAFYPTRLTPKAVAKELNRGEASIRKMMNRMNNDGQIDNDGLGNYTVINKNNNRESQVSQVSLKSLKSQVSLKSQTSESDSGHSQSHSPCHSKTAINTNEIGDLPVRVTGVTPVTPNDQNEKSSDSSSDSSSDRSHSNGGHSSHSMSGIPTYEISQSEINDALLEREAIQAYENTALAEQSTMEMTR